jgi:hypothetical protein
MCNDAPFLARRVGSTGHEILNPRGQVIGWTASGN